jgi:cytochrome oxidase Cu insertion factor (SCO1/SenC/PrrC family)
MKVLLSVLLMMTVLGAACSPATTPSAPTAFPATAEPTPQVEEGAPTEVSTGSEANTPPTNTPAPAVSLPAWQTTALVNARTGESFTFADFAGKTVYVEPMATWCTNCRAQMNNLRAAQSQLGDDVVLVALSVETNLTAEQLARYADDNDFDWTFAVLTPDALAALVDAFGRAVTSPPSTPHFIIRPDGTTTDLATGIKSTDAIVAGIQAEMQAQ